MTMHSQNHIKKKKADIDVEMKKGFTHTLLIPWYSLMVAWCSVTSSRVTVSSSVEYIGSEYPET